MENIGIIDIISIIIDIIAVGVSIWSCIIAKKAKSVANNAINMIKLNNNGSQNGRNVVLNQGKNTGSMIGEQNVN